MDDGLAADGASYCPSFSLLDDSMDDTLAAALGRPVTEGCPEPRPDEAVGFAVTGELDRQSGMRGAPVHAVDADTLVARLIH